MLNGLDLFSGIGGVTLGLMPWVRPLAYCENDKYAQSVILSRISQGSLPWAPIWDNVETLSGSDLFPRTIDIIYGGFPCQDISIAGHGKGLAGKRSGLVKEIFRLTSELRPSFVFLENVPAIRTRGADVVIGEMARLGYDARWFLISAAEVGAPHLRNRWFMLAADSKRIGVRVKQGGLCWTDRQRPSFAINDGQEESMANTEGKGFCPRGVRSGPSETKEIFNEYFANSGSMENSTSKRRNSERTTKPGEKGSRRTLDRIGGSNWWAVEPDVGRMANGVPNRLHRLRGLGNAVVPAQARQAFKRLIGLK